MPKVAYLTHRFNSASRRVIEQANVIIAEYQAEGMVMTLRQIYYQFIARDWFPAAWVDEAYNKKHGLDPTTKNTIKNYDKLQDLLSIARLAGLVDWEAMEDRTRHLRDLGHWADSQDMLGELPHAYREDLWKSQPCRVEVWIEKDALVGVIESICNELRVPYFSCRGYTSQSEQWRAGNRLSRYIAQGQKPVILHFGDHDPSGLDMTRDNTDRLEMFTGGSVDFRRMALNMDQIEKYNPPPNPTKATDGRAPAYIAEYGDECWELDALEPRVITALIRDEVKKIRNVKLWKAALEQESAERETLVTLAQRYDEVKIFLSNSDE